MIKLFSIIAGALAVLVVASALPAGGASAQTGNARVRVLHASPDAPAVDVYVDGSEAISDLAFAAITDYVSLPAGPHAIKVFPASANGSGTPVIDVPSLALEAGKDYTVAAVGQVAAIEPLVLVDNNAAPAAGKAHVRVVHLSPNAPNVDIYAAGAGVVVPNLAFKAAANYLPLDAGTYDLEVRGAGSSTAVLSLPDTSLEAGRVYSAFAIGLAGGTPPLTVKLTVDATAAAATASPGNLPSSGGVPPSADSGIANWLLIAGAGLIALTAVSYTLARRPASNA